MSARDELAKIIYDADPWLGIDSHSQPTRPIPWLELDQDDRENFHPQADAILAAGYSKPRTITEVVGVNTLPWGAAIRTAQGYKLEKLRDGWHRPGVDYAYTPNPHWLPATVLYEP